MQIIDKVLKNIELIHWLEKGLKIHKPSTDVDKFEQRTKTSNPNASSKSICNFFC